MNAFLGRHEIATEDDYRCICGALWHSAGNRDFSSACPTCKPENYITMSLAELIKKYGEGEE